MRCRLQAGRLGPPRCCRAAAPPDATGAWLAELRGCLGAAAEAGSGTGPPCRRQSQAAYDAAAASASDTSEAAQRRVVEAREALATAADNAATWLQVGRRPRGARPPSGWCPAGYSPMPQAWRAQQPAAACWSASRPQGGRPLYVPPRRPA
jgi:hypothetical protein